MITTFSSSKILPHIYDPTFQPTRLSLLSSSAALVANGAQLQIFDISTSDVDLSNISVDDGNVARSNNHSVTAADSTTLESVTNLQSITCANAMIYGVDTRGSIVSVSVDLSSSSRLGTANVSNAPAHSTSGGWHGITVNDSSLATASYLSNTITCYDRSTMVASRRLRTIGAPTSVHFASSVASESTLLVTEGCMFAAYDARMQEQGDITPCI